MIFPGFPGCTLIFQQVFAGWVGTLINTSTQDDQTDAQWWVPVRSLPCKQTGSIVQCTRMSKPRQDLSASPQKVHRMSPNRDRMGSVTESTPATQMGWSPFNALSLSFEERASSEGKRTGGYASTGEHFVSTICRQYWNEALRGVGYERADSQFPLE